MRSRIVSIAFSAVSLSLIACAPSVGPTVEAPEIPISDSARSMQSGARVSLQGAMDVRPRQIETVDQTVTEPGGPVGTVVGNALKQALEKRGVTDLATAPIALRAEVRKWQAEVNAKETGQLDSEAALFIELSDSTGRRIYSGTYVGNRSSQFPLISTTDIRESLGLAMASAIDQALTDPQLVQKLSAGY